MTDQNRDLDAILARVHKMLNTEGRTPEEAAAYVEKAHAILAQYDLSIEDVGTLKADPRTAIAKGEATTRTTRGKPDGWKADLLTAVAAAFECRVLRSSEWETTKSGRGRWFLNYHLVGFKHDLEAARWAFNYLESEIVRQSKVYSKTHWDAIKALAVERGITNHEAESEYTWSFGTHPLKAEIYFVKGAAQTISFRLSQESGNRRRMAAEANPFGLVVQKEAEIEEFLGIEQYGDRWPEVKARRAAMKAEQEARWAAGSDLAKAMQESQPKAKPETAKQRAKREAKEAREQERWERRYWNEQARIDHDALRAGQRAGEKIDWKERVS